MSDQQVYERVLAELRRCEERADELRAFVRVYEEFAGISAPAQLRAWESLAVDVLRKSGRPMRVVDLYRIMAADGFSLESSRPADVLGTRLGRSPAFRRVKRGTYAPAQGYASSCSTEARGQ